MSNPNEKKLSSFEKEKSVSIPDKSEQTAVEKTPTLLVTHTDAYIHERMKAQPRSLEDIEVMVVDKDPRPDHHRLSLPKELKEYEKKYAFRWIFKKRQAIDWACNVRGWLLVKHIYFPDLPDFLFTMNSSIEEGDNILAFMPKKQAEDLRAIPGKRSNEAIKSQIGAHRGNPNYYVPKDEEDDHVIGL